MNNHRELIVWQKSMLLVELVYELSALFPDEEKYSLTNQVRRSAVSIPSNIAEGAGRNSKKEFRNFLGIANGSLNELNTQLELSKRLGFVSDEVMKKIFDLGDEVQKMIYTLINKFSNI
ncbi:four helix bundle protein [Flagellimonas onchidii]|uniref:four helix bundle protein n=1 Tax=Flagellimonas onchidii TaxID=2562684 RepID=UPI0010A6933F|nr:four helix bundle protein [Allomuricauda onchidii]